MMRVAKMEELRGLMEQQEGHMQVARGIVVQRRAIGRSMYAAQLVGAGVAQTPASQLHTMVAGCFTQLKEMGVVVPEKVESAASARDHIARHIANQRSALASTSSVVTQSAEELTAVDVEVQEAGTDAVALAFEKAWKAGAKDDRWVALETPDPGEGLRYPPPSVTYGNQIRVFIPKVAYSASGAKVYSCPWPYCSKYQAKPTTCRATVVSHIRSEHTREVLVCPRREACIGMRSGQEIFTTTSDQSLRAHWLSCAGVKEGHKKPVKVVMEDVFEDDDEQ